MESLKTFATESNLLQVVEFNTWSRTINGIKKESLLYHVYINNLQIFDSIYHDTPIFGDHLLVIIKLTIKNLNTPNDPLMRNWSRYNTHDLNLFMIPLVHSKLAPFINCSVQSYWNLIENVLINTADWAAPLFKPRPVNSKKTIPIPNSVTKQN